MPVELWFPVPLMIVDVEPAIRDSIHAKVTAYLASENARRDVTPAPAESVETTYYKPSLSILADAGLSELEAIVFRAGAEFIQGIGVTPFPLEMEHAWINVFRPGAQEAQHSHDGSLLSATYYVEAPENCGDFVVPDPIGARRSYRAFTNTAGSTLFNMPDVSYKPQAGRMIMFESWLPHSIQCNKSDKVRISLAFNLRPAGADHTRPGRRPAISNNLMD
jgi:uncharacterized protein (TIGR02466 family)